MSRLTNAGMLLAHRTHMNRRRAAVSHIVSGLLKKFFTSYGYYEGHDRINITIHIEQMN